MSYSDSILEAIDTLLGNALAAQKNVKVLDAEVIQLIDANIGLYSVSYLDRTLKAYTNTKTVQYDKGDKVYVLSQDGTLDGNLIIIGSSSPYADLYDKANKIQYRTVAKNIFLSVNDNQPIELCTYQSPMEIDNININYGKNFATIFSHYLDKYKTFCFSMDVKTDIKDPYQRVNGDYGLQITIPIIKNVGQENEQEDIYTYKFNIDKMEGSPYDFNVFTTQKVYLPFDENVIYNSSLPFKISAFCQDFKRDDAITEADIFISNVEFYPVEVIDPSQMIGTYLALNATQGNYFIKERFSTVKEITPQLFLNGNEISLNDCDIYWFVEDASITPVSEQYIAKGGTGWRCLNDYTETETIDGMVEDILDTRQLKLTVKQSDILTSQMYKCVVVYKKELIKQTILLENLDSEVTINVSTSPSLIINNSKVTMTCSTTLLNDDYDLAGGYLTYIWSRYDTEDNLLDIDFYEKGLNDNTLVINEDGHRVYISDIEFNANIIKQAYNRIICSVYIKTENEMILLGTAKQIVVLDSASDFYLSMVNANKSYKYDSYGNSPMLPTYDGPVSPDTRIIEPISFKIYKKDGSEFTDIEYNSCVVSWSLPKNSMMKFKNFSYVEDGNSHFIVSKQGKFDIDYEIRSSYSASATDNSISVQVSIKPSESEEEIVLSGTADIRFFKEGENGTNGTRYSAVVTYEGLGYNVLNASGIPQKLQLLYIADINDYGYEIGTGKWYYKDINNNLMSDIQELTDKGIVTQNGKTFGLELYKDGNLVDASVTYTVTWSMFDQEATSPYITIDSDGILKPGEHPVWSVPSEIRASIVQAAVKVTDSSENNADQIIYVYYPIEVTRILSNAKDALVSVPTMKGGFDSVLYANDGTTPSWDSSRNFECENGIYNNDINDIYTYKWIGSKNVQVKEDDKKENSCKGTPIDKYENTNANNYVAAEMYPNDTAVEVIENLIKLSEDKIATEEQTLAEKYITYQELRNLFSTFDYIKYSEEDEQKLQDKIDKLSSDKLNAEAQLVDLNAEYQRKLSGYTDDYNTLIIQSQNSLKTYTRNIYSLLKNIYGNVTNFDINNNVEKYSLYLSNMLGYQNPIIDGVSYSNAMDNYKNATAKLNKSWESADNTETIEEIYYQLDLLRKLDVSDANYRTNAEAIAAIIVGYDVRFKGLVADIIQYTELQYSTSQILDIYKETLNNLIKDVITQYGSQASALNALVNDYSIIYNAYLEDNSDCIFKIYNNNNNLFLLNNQQLASYNQKKIEKENIITTYEESIKDLEIAISNYDLELSQAIQDLSAMKNLRRSELLQWENIIVDNDYMAKRAIAISTLLRILAPLDNEKDTVYGLKGFKAFFEQWSILPSTYDYEKVYNDIKTIVESELVKLYNTISIENNANLKPIENVKIIITEQQYEEINKIILEQISDSNTVIESLKKIIIGINSEIDNYNNNVNYLKSKDISQIQNIYNKIQNFYEKSSTVKNAHDKDTLQNFFEFLGLEVTEDICDVISQDITDIIDDAETTLEILPKIDNKFQYLSNSISKILDSFKITLLDDYYNLGNKQINTANKYKNILLYNFFMTLKEHSKIYYSGGSPMLSAITFNDEGTGIDLIEIYKQITTKDIPNSINIIDKENDNIGILFVQKNIINNQLTSLHIKPIVFRTNTFEFAYLNGWDGNKLYIDEEGEYILSPQMGAGAKNENNQFIGLVMGVKQKADGVNSDIGLFGMSEKGQSIFLDAKTGKAQFGVSGSGQINIDPTLTKNGKGRALLYSADFFTKDGVFSYDNETDTGSKTGQGMLIDLSEPCIKFGSGGFWVDKDGCMHVGGTNSVNAQADHSPSPEIEYNDPINGVYNDTLSSFTYVTPNNLFIDTLGNIYQYDYPSETFKSNGVTYPVRKSITQGEQFILTKKVDGIYKYFYYDGANQHELFYIDKLYEGDITATGLGANVTRHVYYNSDTHDYWFVNDDKLVPIYLNLDRKKYVYHQPENENYYYYYEANNDETKYWYDSRLQLYVDYDKGSNIFYFIDSQRRFDPPGVVWKYDLVANSYYYEKDGTIIYLGVKTNEMGGWRIGQDRIYSENYNMTLFSGFNSDKNPAIFTNPDKNPEQHNSLESVDRGAYFGPDGVSIGDALRATNDKGTFIGKLSSSSKTYWRIYGNNRNSYIYYNAKTSEDAPSNINFERVSEEENDEHNKIYIGTDGIVIGNEFKIDINGAGSSRTKGMTYIGNLSKGAYWRFHTKYDSDFDEEVAYMFYDKEDKSDSNARLTVFNEKTKDNMYIATNGIRVGYNVMVRPGNHTQLFGYLPNKNGRFMMYYSPDESGDGSNQSFIYSNRSYDPAKTYALTANLESWKGGFENINDKTKRDVYIGTNGIRLGEAFRVDGYLGGGGGKGNLKVGIMKEDFYLGTKNADGSITWELYSGGGGGGDLPQAENYSF